MPGISEEHGRDLMVVMNRTQAVRELALEVAKVAPSRELSLAITKLEEAEMWAGRAARADRAQVVERARRDLDRAVDDLRAAVMLLIDPEDADSFAAAFTSFREAL